MQASERVNEVRTNIFEEVSAARDAHQVIISTVGDLISARRVTAEVGATQCLGQMDNATLTVALARSKGLTDLGRTAAMRNATELRS